MRQVSQEGVELIKRFEGLELESYQDVAGIWTIGYGHTGPEVGPGMTITEAQAEALLKEDLDRFERGVADAVKADISQSQFDALVSLAYNIGVSAFKKSTALKRLNKGNFEGAAEAITWWNKATINGRKRVVTGLARRRAAESALFMQDVGNDPREDRGMVVEENTPRRSNPLNSRTVGGATTAGTAGAVGAGSAVLRGNGEGGGAVPADADLPAPNPLPVDDQDQPGEAPDDEGASDGAGGNGTTDGEPETESGEDTPSELADAAVGCLDPQTGEYLLPEEALAGEPLGDPIDGDTTEPVLDEVDPPYCTAEQLAELRLEKEVPVPGQQEVGDAIAIGAGAVAVLAALYVIGARIDDWLKFRR